MKSSQLSALEMVDIFAFGDIFRRLLCIQQSIIDEDSRKNYFYRCYETQN